MIPSLFHAADCALSRTSTTGCLGRLAMQVMTQALSGRVPVCLVTDGYVCIFLLVNTETVRSGNAPVKRKFKYYVCFTCAAEEGRATAFQVLYYLLKGPASALDPFAGITAFSFPDREAVAHDKELLNYISAAQARELRSAQAGKEVRALLDVAQVADSHIGAEVRLLPPPLTRML